MQSTANGVNEAKKIIDEQRKAVSGEPKNLEEQAISLVGTHIYEKLVKGYTEKQWGRDCKDLPAFISNVFRFVILMIITISMIFTRVFRSADTIRSRRNCLRVVKFA